LRELFGKKNFHPDFVPKAELDKKVKDGGFDSWVDLHQDAYYWYNNTETPTIFSWKVLNKVSQPVHQLERNAYYWKVDAAGQQLPYFDRMDRQNVGTREQMPLLTIAGEFDYMHPYHTNYAENYPLLKNNEAAGNYKLLPTAGWSDCIGTVNFNFSHPDPFLRELFGKKNFRIALSHALNRQEINNTRFKGQYGMPSSPAPPDGPPYYGESEQFNRYAKYDVAKANQLLDELGLKWDARKEERLRPDGSKLNINMLVYIGWGQSVEVSEMYKKYWDDVGINVNLKPLSSSLQSQQRSASQHDLSFGPVNWGGRRPIIPSSGVSRPRWTPAGRSTRNGVSGFTPTARAATSPPRRPRDSTSCTCSSQPSRILWSGRSTRKSCTRSTATSSGR
jgi:peptide/nickel transport system substrate-binding protein